MKFKGKIGLWWFVTIILAHVLLIFLMQFAKTMLGQGLLIAILLLLDVFMVSWTVNNYVKLNADHFTIHFGFSKNSVNYEDVIRISKSNSVIAGSALSFDRLLVETQDKQIIISLKENDLFIDKLIGQNNKVIVMER
ncbi:PH domain-containing protein [Fusibacter bizertensis]